MKNSTRTLSVLLVLLMMMSVFAVSANAAEFRDYYPTPEFICGDVNFDSDVSVKDATTIQKYLAKLITLPEELVDSGDVDGNEKLTISDATLIQKFVAHIIDVFPVEDYSSDYEYTANGEELKVEFLSGSFSEVKITVETYDFYEIIATADQADISFDLVSEDMEKHWGSVNKEDNMYIYAYLEPGVYYANIYSFDDVDCVVTFKAGVSQSEPPFDLDDMELAPRLNIGDKLDIEGKAGKYVYYVALSEPEAEDGIIIYVENPDAKVDMVSYTSDYYATSYSEWAEGVGTVLEVYGDGYALGYYVVVTVDEGSDDFTLCCDSVYGMLKNMAVDVTLDEAVKLDVAELTDEYDDEIITLGLAQILYRFTPKESGFYSFNFESKQAMMVSVAIVDFESSDDGYIFVDLSEGEARLFDVLQLNEGVDYYIVGVVTMEAAGDVSFVVSTSDEEEYQKAQDKDSIFDDATDDEVEYKEITLGEPVLVEFDATDDEFVTEDFVFTATEDCTIVLYSENSQDACVFVLDDMGTTLHMGDSIHTSFYVPPTYDFYYSDDFAVIGTVAKGETVYFSLCTYAEGSDSFYFTVVDEADFSPIEW